MTLSHDAAGSGPALVLLHSGVCDRRMWDPQWEALQAAGYRVVRADLRGFGETPAKTGDYDPVADVWELLDSLGIERAALVGASYGGKLALAAAARHPERVTALALLASGLPGRAPSAELRAWGAREDALLEADDLEGAVALNVETWLGPDATPGTRAAVADMQRHAFRIQLAAEAAAETAEPSVPAANEAEAAEQIPPTAPTFDLSGIAAPALAITGAHDFADYREIAVALADLLPNARHLDLDWAGHLPSLERPEEVTALLLDFLTGAGVAKEG
ncbi:alpha/beta fold hydrolase [Streptomyces lavendulae]|uniref:alpha/beta fold hydrolase n=1 Tax=Streptomyces lavendulae TaxID=1914 RepID=UPI0004BECF76|nr:alpha/beta hydrolase [Streptomyces lavendulae]